MTHDKIRNWTLSSLLRAWLWKCTCKTNHFHSSKRKPGDMRTRQLSFLVLCHQQGHPWPHHLNTSVGAQILNSQQSIWTNMTRLAKQSWKGFHQRLCIPLMLLESLEVGWMPTVSFHHRLLLLLKAHSLSHTSVWSSKQLGSKTLALCHFSWSTAVVTTWQWWRMQACGRASSGAVQDKTCCGRTGWFLKRFWKTAISHLCNCCLSLMKLRKSSALLFVL